MFLQSETCRWSAVIPCGVAGQERGERWVKSYPTVGPGRGRGLSWLIRDCSVISGPLQNYRHLTRLENFQPHCERFVYTVDILPV